MDISSTVDPNKRYLNDSTERVIMSLSYKLNILVVCVLLIPLIASNISDLLTSVDNTTIDEFAFLLAMHGYNVTYINKVFYLDGNNLQDIMNDMQPKTIYS